MLVRRVPNLPPAQLTFQQSAAQGPASAPEPTASGSTANPAAPSGNGGGEEDFGGDLYSEQRDEDSALTQLLNQRGRSWQVCLRFPTPQSSSFCLPIFGVNSVRRVVVCRTKRPKDTGDAILELCGWWSGCLLSPPQQRRLGHTRLLCVSASSRLPLLKTSHVSQDEINESSVRGRGRGRGFGRGRDFSARGFGRGRGRESEPIILPKGYICYRCGQQVSPAC